MQRRENFKTALAGKQNPSDSAPRKLEGEEQQTGVQQSDQRLLGRFPRRCWTKARAAKFLSFVHHLPMGRPHHSSHGSSVSLGAFGQHLQPVLLERRLHFFVLRPGDSSEEAQRGFRKGSPSRQELGILLQLLCGDTDAKYSSSFPIPALFPLTVPFVSLLLISQTPWPDFCTWCACERIPWFSYCAQIVLPALSWPLTV